MRTGKGAGMQSSSRGLAASRPGGLVHLARKVLHRPQFWFGFVTLVPLLIWYSVVSFWSVIQAFRISLIHYRLLGPGRFVGLDNFRELFDDPRSEEHTSELQSPVHL